MVGRLNELGGDHKGGGVMGKPMLRVGLLASATSCVGLGCAVAADKREVPDVDHYVEKNIFLLSRIREYYHNEDLG